MEITTEPEVIITQKNCERCNHKWLPRSSRRPAVCPKCNSARWYEPKGPNEPGPKRAA